MTTARRQRSRRDEVLFEQLLERAVDLDKRAHRAVTARRNAAPLGHRFPDRTVDPTIAQMFKDAADAYVVAVDAGLETYGTVDTDPVLFDAATAAREAIWNAIRWSHPALEGHGWSFTVARYAITPEEANRLLHAAHARILAERPHGGYEVWLEDEQRAVHMPSFELTVPMDGLRVVLGRTERSWSDLMSRYDLDPAPRWYIREIASWERGYPQ